MKKLYLVYQITNTVNGKIYIGRHVTTKVDDGYMGSGARLRYAKKKYGLTSFVKTILGVFDSEEEMIKVEAELVSESFLLRKDVYNVQQGGRGGGWEEVNRSGRNLRTGAILSDETKMKIALANKGKSPSVEARKKMSQNSCMKNPLVREKMAQSMKKPKTEEHRKKIAEAIKKWHQERKCGISSVVE